MNKNFLNAINDIKKQKAKQNQKKDSQQKQEENVEQDQNEQNSKDRKMSKLQAMKKKIMKDSKEKSEKCKQGKYKTNSHSRLNIEKVAEVKSLQIDFMSSPGYDKIYPIIKTLKIYVREIDDSHINFNDVSAYEKAKELFNLAGLKFTTKE